MPTYTELKETAMGRSKVMLAVVAVLVATVSVSVLARGTHSGGGRSHGGHAFSGRIGSGNLGSHPYGGVRAVAPRPHFVGGARFGVVIGVPLLAPLIYPAPGYYYSPPPTYIEPAPSPGYWYFCPQLNAYYPYVQECPGGWQPVLPHPAG